VATWIRYMTRTNKGGATVCVTIAMKESARFWLLVSGIPLDEAAHGAGGSHPSPLQDYMTKRCALVRDNRPGQLAWQGF